MKTSINAPAAPGLGVVLALLTVLGACAGSDEGRRTSAERQRSVVPAGPTSSTLAQVYGRVQGVDQTGDGTRLVIGRAELRGTSGFVVVHAENQGGPGAIVGHAAIAEGMSENVVVDLDAQVPSGPYWAMLHRDAGTAGVFEWPGPDGPVRPPVGLRYAQTRIVLAVQPAPNP